ncbi:MAG TPA: copper resistance CopC family protein [Chloroflexota bacterium]
MFRAHPGQLRWLAPFAASGLLTVATSTATVWAHARPQTTSPQPNARLDTSPAHIAIDYDDGIDPSGSSLALLDATGSLVATTTDTPTSNRTAAVSPTSDLAPGPYTVDWTSLDATDGHEAQGFYTFVVNGGPVGIIAGQAQAQTQAGDLMTTLTVTAAPDGGSLLRVDLDNRSGVERVRIRLSRPDLGEDLLDTQPTTDGGWVLSSNDVALPGAWHAVAIVRRTNIFDDAQASFDFTVDALTGAPAFAAASAGGMQ